MFSVVFEKYGTPNFSFQKFQCRWLAVGSETPLDSLVKSDNEEPENHQKDVTFCCMWPEPVGSPPPGSKGFPGGPLVVSLVLRPVPLHVRLRAKKGREEARSRATGLLRILDVRLV